ncbi:PEP/pyruvate-binding domain-containing protein [Pseudodesulfovibrio piezophilus]|uniref:Phosphoenolpyruvate synthase n=1 Tax=Pseudodesulfovibrio piezophilus (strain DSM 21447 / JCM 15486 / C1TLV30) TaxID=1322246 RepID=M1WKS0_PSEP2|nr:PEP/pyruvate-binding domain-containing protein [Pseudodesulfovibrio piezophilus]CCH50086.1 Pyruvate, water dikinase [Pseudodesulfovibrio piezophilus C1TLV30]
MNRVFDYIRTRLLPGRQRERRSLAALFSHFQRVLELNNRTLTTIASMHSKLGGGYIFDLQYLRSSKQYMVDTARELLDAFDAMAPGKYPELYASFRDIRSKLESELERRPILPDVMVIPFEDIGPKDMDAVGAKNTRLGIIAKTSSVTVPSGFAVTTSAYLLFMEHNGLGETIKGYEEAWRAGNLPAKDASDTIQALILAGTIPTRLRRALNRESDALRRKLDDKDVRFAVRSSAWGEDGALSFAGQYDSYLNVTSEGLLDAYKKVLASTFSPSAMEYRREYDFKPDEVYMAVSVQGMVQARTSGVMYSLSPVNPKMNCIDIAGVWGLGAPVVSGKVKVDRFAVSRDSGHAVLSESIAEKPLAQYGQPGGSVEMEPVPEDLQAVPSLSSEEIHLLAVTAMRLEQYFKKPQDIEYAFDQDGALVVLQARPLRIAVCDDAQSPELSDALKAYPVLLSGEGDVGQQGVGAGPVFVAWEGRDLETFPDGALLVAHVSSPQYASILHRASGVVTDIGSPLGHMATIAREYRVPSLLNASRATMVLQEGEMVTLDAEQKTVYQGLVKELKLHDFMCDRMEETYEYRLLRRMLKLIEPLNLFDPTAGNFTPQGCQTLHDIARFIHEKSVEILTDIPNASAAGEACPGGRLELPVPLDLVVLDIGGGLAPECAGGLHGLRTRRTIRLDQVESTTLHSFVNGMTLDGVWQSTPVPVDFSSFMSSMTRTFSTDTTGAQRIGQNLAVISNQYLHLSLKLGYHFTMIDCYESVDGVRNVVQFRFAGGVTGVTRRSRRAKFLSNVLKTYDFSVTVKEDLVVARAKGRVAQDVHWLMYILGVVVAYTRQLDVSMVNDAQVLEHCEEFERIVNQAISN